MMRKKIVGREVIDARDKRLKRRTSLFRFNDLDLSFQRNLKIAISTIALNLHLLAMIFSFLLFNVQRINFQVKSGYTN